MIIDDKVIELIEKASSGNLDSFNGKLQNSDFGVFIPTYNDDGTIRLMQDGYSQVETNLKVTVRNSLSDLTSGSQVVAWLGNIAGKDSSCSHGGIRDCTHCTGHNGECRHCSTHKDSVLPEYELKADELDYNQAIEELKDKKEVLNELAEHEFGLALLHGHNSEYKFTKLPENYISVISNGETQFRTVENVDQDETFVPNTWRYLNGKLQIAGGFSDN